jgi:hypothetical protein
MIQSIEIKMKTQNLKLNIAKIIAMNVILIGRRCNVRTNVFQSRLTNVFYL